MADRALMRKLVIERWRECTNWATFLEHIIDSLDDGTLAQHYLVPDRHKFVLYVRFQSSDNVCSVLPQCLKELPADASFVRIQFSEEIFLEYAEYHFIAVVHVATCQYEIYQFSFVTRIAGEA